MQFAPIAVFILGVPILIRAFLAFDGLVALQRSQYPAAWKSDGCPRPILQGMFRTKFSLSGWLATQRCAFSWVFRTPSWATADPIALATFRRLRVAVAIWNLVVMPLFAVTAVLSAGLVP